MQIVFVNILYPLTTHYLIIQVLHNLLQFLSTPFLLLLHLLLVVTSLVNIKVNISRLSLTPIIVSQGVTSSLIPADVNSSVLMAAAVSVPLSLLIALCMAWRRWRKRGKGSVRSSSGGKNWNVGDILGRSKEGFRPLSTDEGENMLDGDSDSEVFSQNEF